MFCSAPRGQGGARHSARRRADGGAGGRRERRFRSVRALGPPAAVAGAAAAAEPRRSRGAGASDRPGRRADAHARRAEARLDDLLGPAGLRQDDGGAADRQAGQGRVRPGLGDPFRRRRAEEDLRDGAGAPRRRPRDAAVRRRDPSLQPRPAGFVSARDGGRLDHADRRDDREPVVRAQRGAAVARARAGLPPARRGGDREAGRARRERSSASRCRSTRRRARR